MVRKLDKNNDWTFGRNKANYIRANSEILQNVSTRLKSFKNDWIFDLDSNIDWFNLLGSYNKEREIKKEVSRVVLQTVGVLRINSLDIITNNDTRDATININIDTIYSENIDLITKVD